MWLPLTRSLLGDLACSPGMCRRLGIKTKTLWFTGRHPVHWATPARAPPTLLQSPFCSITKDGPASHKPCSYCSELPKVYNIPGWQTKWQLKVLKVCVHKAFFHECNINLLLFTLLRDALPIKLYILCLIIFYKIHNVFIFKQLCIILHNKNSTEENFLFINLRSQEIKETLNSSLYTYLCHRVLW